MSGVRIVVVSDRRLSGLALAGALDRVPGTSVIAKVGQVAEAKGCCERGEADAALVDASVLVQTELGPGQHPAAMASSPAGTDRPWPPMLAIAEPAQKPNVGWSFEADLLVTLTPRELEVFLLLGTGLSNANIGLLLGVSQATVKSHVGRILAKLKLESRLQAGLAAMTHAAKSSLHATG